MYVFHEGFNYQTRIKNNPIFNPNFADASSDTIADAPKGLFPSYSWWRRKLENMKHEPLNTPQTLTTPWSTHYHKTKHHRNELTPLGQWREHIRLGPNDLKLWHALALANVSYYGPRVAIGPTCRAESLAPPNPLALHLLNYGAHSTAGMVGLPIPRPHVQLLH